MRLSRVLPAIAALSSAVSARPLIEPRALVDVCASIVRLDAPAPVGG